MIAAKIENIYGIDVYTFYSSKRNPYQLTFNDDSTGKYVEVALVNLLGSNDSRYCPSLRSAICTWCYSYMFEKRCTLYFDMELQGKHSFLLFSKFIRWIELEDRVKVNVEITPYEGRHFVEFYIRLNPDYLKSIEVAES